MAFLRGINVGGRKLIKMDDLRQAFVSMGFKDVKTYLQNGNVIFDSAAADGGALTREIEQSLQESLGYEVAVFLGTIQEVEEVVKLNSFNEAKLRPR